MPDSATDGQSRAALIAGRVRALRARRGASRKLLAQHARVSERYLAQVEQAQANITIAVLEQIAAALDADVVELLSSAPQQSSRLSELLAGLDEDQQEEALELLTRHFARGGGAYRGVALIGLRGAGKTTVGRALAQARALRFLQLTDIIEELARMSVGEVFALGGQKMYRRLEAEAVQQVIDSQPGVVLETGGSLVSSTGVWNTLQRYFWTVWLKTDPHTHMQRVVSQGDTRPMAGNDSAMDDLRRILHEREPLYRRANYQLDTSTRGVQDCVDELSAALPAL